MGLRHREGGGYTVIATNSMLVSQPFFLEMWESVKRGRRKVVFFFFIKEQVKWREKGREKAF